MIFVTWVLNSDIFLVPSTYRESFSPQGGSAPWGLNDLKVFIEGVVCPFWGSFVLPVVGSWFLAARPGGAARLERCCFVFF